MMFVLPGATVKADTTSDLLVQAGPAESAEPIDSCVALQEVSTGETEIRKRIENRAIARGNWNTDFLVPSGQQFSYFVAILVPEHNAPYHFTPTLRFSNGASESPFSVRSDLVNGEIYSIPFQSSTDRQSNMINARVGGVNGNFYTISVVGCQ
ncbi:MAG: hypothetical protein Kow00121_10120 [Elainellaceae cyanobacterium]